MVLSFINRRIDWLKLGMHGKASNQRAQVRHSREACANTETVQFLSTLSDLTIFLVGSDQNSHVCYHPQNEQLFCYSVLLSEMKDQPGRQL